MGLYGGLDVDDIHKRKGLDVGQIILDYIGGTMPEDLPTSEKSIQQVEKEQNVAFTCGLAPQQDFDWL